MIAMRTAWKRSLVYRIIAQVGNYGESYERHFGAESTLKFARDVNALWIKGGVMNPLPLR